MGLFDRVSRLVRAEINSSQVNHHESYLSEGTTLVAAGAMKGASLGRVGVLTGGQGFSLGSIPLIASGALTGAALYEALRSIIESDTSSICAAGIGAAAGAATSASIGGVGVAVGGGAIGVGITSMAAGGAVVGLGLVGINRLLQNGIDPLKQLDIAIEQMESDHQRAQQAIVSIIASQKRLQQQYDQTELEIKKWKYRAQLALDNNNEDLAREALKRKWKCSKILEGYNSHLNYEPKNVRNLKKNLTLLKNKINEAKTMQISLKATIANAKANEQGKNSISSVDTSSAMAAFERMENKVLQMEASSEALTELSGNSLEDQFTELEMGTGFDIDLEEMKAQLIGTIENSTPPPKRQLQVDVQAAEKAPLDAELEQLKSELDEL